MSKHERTRGDASEQDGLRRSLHGRFRKRLGTRGFSAATVTLEAAGIMGWFVITILSEKYLGDATSSRRAAENAAQQANVSSASGFCMGGGSALATMGAFKAMGSSNMFSNGVPQLTPAQIPALLAMVGVVSLKTLPIYFMQFMGSQTTTSAGSVTSMAPGSRATSGQFQGVRNMACLEKSLELPGAPWTSIMEARGEIYIKNILGY